jgi:hypothetical protein
VIYIELFLLIIFFIVLAILFYYVVLTGVMAAPFLPTASRDLDRVLKAANLKKDMKFVDLGSGDGRLVIQAVRKYDVMGVGVEYNPLLVYFSRFWAWLYGLKDAVFVQGKLEEFSLRDAQVVYIFLLPKAMIKLESKIKRECRKGTLIISRGFKAPGLKPIEVMETKTYWTYFYRV